MVAKVRLNLPIGLILFRLLMAPVILGLAYFIGESAKPVILLLMYLGLISDILDGIIARKQKQSSARLRRMDSQTDMIFWVSIGFTTWILYPELLVAHAAVISTIFGMEIACYVISIVKFKRETCTYAFLSKLWGLTLLIAFTSLIGFNHAGVPLYSAVFMGLISHLDRILITLLLPQWTHDIPSAYHAYLIRKGIEFKRNEYLNG
jgi:phosphatidylglycerophosphate synthase